MKKTNQRLGRGLAALIANDYDQTNQKEVRDLPISSLRASPSNPRQDFSESELIGLSSSIKEKGVIQPIIVRLVENTIDTFEIIAGERRWRASKYAGLEKIPALVYPGTDKDALEIGIVENVQRKNLNPIEEAIGYESLITDFSYSQDIVSKIVGKSRCHITNTLRLRKLPEDIQQCVRDGSLTAGHARAMLKSAHPDKLAAFVIENKLSVRDTEKLARDEKENSKVHSRIRKAKREDTLTLERMLSTCLGLKTTINPTNDTTGSVTIRYKTTEQFQNIIQLLQQAYT